MRVREKYENRAEVSSTGTTDDNFAKITRDSKPRV
jgi:hypothetical protein